MDSLKRKRKDEVKLRFCSHVTSWLKKMPESKVRLADWVEGIGLNGCCHVRCSGQGCGNPFSRSLGFRHLLELSKLLPFAFTVKETSAPSHTPPRPVSMLLLD